MARRRSTPAVSLFAFQDVVTSLTGILLVMTMLLVLDLVHRKTEASPPQRDVLDRLQRATTEALRDEELLRRRASASQEQLQRAAGMLSARIIHSQLKDVEAAEESIRGEMEALESLEVKSKSRRDQAEKALDEKQSAQTDVDAKRRELERRRRQLKDLRDGRRRFYSLPRGVRQDRGLLMVVTANAVEVHPFAGAGEVRRFFNPDPQAVAAQATRFVAEGGWDYCFVLTKPSGAKIFEPLRQELTNRRISFGYDLVDEATAVATSGEGGSP